ncbi:hypothetical protein SLW73_02655 [Glutamicibacter protophormiae]|uniref:hypothetical protein n=1 Tax=Glutamicibacter protophormiae TaxID=37930 RepID=UPI002A80DD3D|nr:hypothetical protein [Glutamicibacter protophormiae]WPR65258.1 hypothetical protein SLW72_02655 [Glutamicibacter protophormiae]WPR68755.1 hypothetical protein SLW73_02655 [Glutamicibacter protophormiae]
MAEHDKPEPPKHVETLKAENAELRENLFIANEIQVEMRQLLANTQFELAATRAKLKYATQPTE